MRHTDLLDAPPALSESGQDLRVDKNMVRFDREPFQDTPAIKFKAAIHVPDRNAKRHTYEPMPKISPCTA